MIYNNLFNSNKKIISLSLLLSGIFTGSLYSAPGVHTQSEVVVHNADAACEVSELIQLRFELERTQQELVRTQQEVIREREHSALIKQQCEQGLERLHAFIMNTNESLNVLLQDFAQADDHVQTVVTRLEDRIEKTQQVAQSIQDELTHALQDAYQEQRQQEQDNYMALVPVIQKKCFVPVPYGLYFLANRQASYMAHASDVVKKEKPSSGFLHNVGLLKKRLYAYWA
jgi:hypothetical protein